MRNFRTLSLITLIGMLSLVGCSRAFYRQQADREVACLIAQKSNDPRWALDPGFNVNVDPRSRYYDQYDPDSPPMPEDDPASHRFMHCVDGKKGWSHWHDNGNRPELENPAWLQRLYEYAPMNEEGEVVLSLDAAMELAYIHSPQHQSQLETLYLSALDVSTERFRLQTQFFGGTGTTFDHLGQLATGGEANTLTQGTDFRLTRRFATAGELLVGFANSFVWQFAGPNSNSSFSILNFSLVQPLLRGAGRDIALEQLTIVERGLLANMRAYTQWRQGFFTSVAIGENGTPGASRRGGFFGGTGLSGFTGQGSGGFGGVGAATGFGRGGFGGTGGGAAGGGFAGGGAGNVGGFIGLLQSLQEIRNSRTSLNAQLQTLSLLESSLDAGIIDLTQVDQFRQSIETDRATLLQAENGLKNSLEFFKTGTLGLPPDLPVALDDSLISPFQLIDDDSIALQDAIVDEQFALGQIDGEVGANELRAVVQAATGLELEFDKVFQQVDENLATLDENREERRTDLSQTELSLLQKDIEQLDSNSDNLLGRYDDLVAQRVIIEQKANNGQTAEAADEMVVWLRDLLGVAQELALVQARAKVESVSVEAVDLDSETAFHIAMTNRLDIMNNRASLVDTWRLIQFNADALQSNLDITLDGDLRTIGDNPLDFRGKTGTMTAGVRFDAPFTRLLERNNYRQQLIEYQQSRRQLIQFYDGVKQGLRSRLREMEQLKVNLEIQRRAVVIAIRRVDLTREELNEPQPPAQPGAPASQLGPTAATNLLTALRDLRQTQNNFMSVYLNYYGNRMLLARDLGTMVLDDNGYWVETPLEGIAQADLALGAECLEQQYPLVPPPLPESLQQIIEKTPAEQAPSVPLPADMEPSPPLPLMGISTNKTVKR